MTISEYIHRIHDRYKTGISTEHSYRGDLQQLLETMLPDTVITNEPIRIKCGAPDYIITRRGIPIGYFEAKDMGSDLLSKGYKEQFDRYRASLPNLIITNYLDFHWHKDGELVTQVSLASIEGTKITPNTAQHSLFTTLIEDFASWSGQTITSSRKLAEMMASKAKLLATIITNVLDEDSTPNGEPSMVKEENITLFDQLRTFKEILIHDITHREFADIYSQTIAYGMFAARLHDPTLKDFTRVEAANLIPKTNPFLRKLFQYIAGYDLDSRITWIVDALADIFRATDVSKLLKDFGSTAAQEDPIIHFYETFLAEYDPALRKARGVWYTPEPVVSFIVRAVDDILKNEFGLKQGLMDNSKTKIKVQSVTKKTADVRSKITNTETEVEIHKVQILDPACGTGTFLAEIIKSLYIKFQKQQGIWSSYVENDLIPRLNGFELLMASYAMAHLKLDLLLTETGFIPTRDQRFKVFLTNSLEEYHPDTGTLFASWLSDEANQANRIKRDTPVMVVIGNPPYSVSSSNKSEWIESLMVTYKEGLNERNINPLSDDYLKFLRFSQHLIEKNGQGVVAMITNNSFLDGLIHRRVRESLLDSFDSIYLIDLHGSTKKRETTLDGEKDENVFDIQQGVAISLFVKTGIGKKGRVLHKDLYGTRETKYKYLLETSLAHVDFVELAPSSDMYFFVPKNLTDGKHYLDYPSITSLFKTYASGFKTERDGLTIQEDPKTLQSIRRDFQNLSEDEIRSAYSLKKDGRDWKISYAKKDLQQNPSEIIPVLYRPFDFRYTLYTGRSKGFLAYPRTEVAKNLVNKTNLSLLTCRQQSTFDFQHALVTTYIADMCSVSLQTKETGYQFPLYIAASNRNTLLNELDYISNLNFEIVTNFISKLGLVFNDEYVSPDLVTEEPGTKVSPVQIFDYVYAILHSPTYRKLYKEFLKIDFPRIPYPKDFDTFHSLVEWGRLLRKIHLLQGSVVENFITSYPNTGNNLIDKYKYENVGDSTGRVWINKSQYFEGVPEISWNFYIGGYQPAQKWLKDRDGRTLSHEDIFHYQKIIVALAETDRIMKEIDKIPFE